MQIRTWHRHEYAPGTLNTRHHRHTVLQIGNRVVHLWHSVGPWVDPAFNRVEGPARG